MAFTSVGKSSTGPLKFAELVEAEKTATEGFFRHGRELLAAINEGAPSFELFETVNDDSDWNLSVNSTYAEIASKIFYETRTTYTIHDATMYINLDNTPDHHAAHVVRELSDDHVVHCPANADGAQAKVGSFVVGSTRGLWATASHAHVSRFLEDSLAQYHPSHVESKRKEGLVLARRVISSSRMLENCYHLATESVLPMELFTKMRIDSYLEQPFRHLAAPQHPKPKPESSQKPKPSESDQTAADSQRELLTESIYAPPRAGSLVTSCNADEWNKYDDDIVTFPATWFNPVQKAHNSLHPLFPNRYSFTGSGSNYQYEVSLLKGGCIEYSADNAIPGTSFLFNYNTVRYLLLLCSCHSLPLIYSFPCWSPLGNQACISGL